MQFEFGQHKGKEASDIPLKYLRWALREAADQMPPSLIAEIHSVLADVAGGAPAMLQAELKKVRAELRSAYEAANANGAELQNARAELESVYEVAEANREAYYGLRSHVEGYQHEFHDLYRKAAFLVHPDRGGNADAMKLLNEMKDHTAALLN